MKNNKILLASTGLFLVAGVQAINVVTKTEENIVSTGTVITKKEQGNDNENDLPAEKPPVAEFRAASAAQGATGSVSGLNYKLNLNDNIFIG